MEWQKIRFAFLLAAAAVLPASGMASIIKKPPVKSTEVTYKDLICTEKHKAEIYELISTIAETDLVSLYDKEDHLNALGDRINGEVHPLKFLAAIFSNPYLKNCMGLIWDSFLKRKEFLKGLGGRLNREMEKKNLFVHLEPFGKEVGIPPENMRPYFDAQDWGNFILFLIHS